MHASPFFHPLYMEVTLARRVTREEEEPGLVIASHTKFTGLASGEEQVRRRNGSEVEGGWRCVAVYPFIRLFV
jgi:hypothetical protein